SPSYITRKEWVLTACKLSRTAHGRCPCPCRSFRHERTRPPSHRRRSRRELARGLGRSRRRRDRGLPCEARHLPDLPGHAGVLIRKARQRAAGPPAVNPYSPRPSERSSIPFGMAPTAFAFGCPPSKRIMFGIDWIP